MTDFALPNHPPRRHFTLISWLFSAERRAERAEAARERETRRQLGDLSDHMLRDIGATR